MWIPKRSKRPSRRSANNADRCAQGKARPHQRLAAPALSAAKSRSAMESWLEKLGITDVNPGVFDGAWKSSGEVVEQASPINGKSIAKVRLASADDYERAVRRAHEAFLKWRTVPAPV